MHEFFYRIVKSIVRSEKKVSPRLVSSARVVHLGSWLVCSSSCCSLAAPPAHVRSSSHSSRFHAHVSSGLSLGLCNRCSSGSSVGIGSSRGLTGFGLGSASLSSAATVRAGSASNTSRARSQGS
ncbi:hypothetical protein PMAYCL1PPCAC_16818, partial [Pristionchus mayeri]